MSSSLDFIRILAGAAPRYADVVLDAIQPLGTVNSRKDGDWLKTAKGWVRITKDLKATIGTLPAGTPTSKAKKAIAAGAPAAPQPAPLPPAAPPAPKALTPTEKAKAALKRAKTPIPTASPLPAPEAGCPCRSGSSQGRGHACRRRPGSEARRSGREDQAPPPQGAGEPR